MQYKTVAGPIGLTITRKESYTDAIRLYAAIIDRESVGGWELLFIQEVPVTKDKGCIAGCLAAIGIGNRYEQRTFNMLVFGNTQGTGAIASDYCLDMNQYNANQYQTNQFQQNQFQQNR